MVNLRRLGVLEEKRLRAIIEMKLARSDGPSSFTDMGLPTTIGPNSGSVSLARRSLLEALVLEEEIKQWEEKLNSIGDDAQLANVDLQNILQKQQQTLRMMSNISQMLYHTAQSVIRKIGS